MAESPRIEKIESLNRSGSTLNRSAWTIYCVVGATTRAPTYEEIEDARNSGRKIVKTSDAPWDPSTTSIGAVKTVQMGTRERTSTANEYDRLLGSCSDVYNEKTVLQRMVAKALVLELLMVE